MANKFMDWLNGERELLDFDRIEAGSAPKAKKAAAPMSVSRRVVTVVSVVCACAILAVLLTMVYRFPVFGTGSATENDLTERYIEVGMTEVGAQNLVANMILVYRGFDTFGESTVLFTAATCVIFLLMVGGHGAAAPDSPEQPQPNMTITQTIVRALFPFVLVFSVYILLNGHLSPGGGFSGGAVLGAGLILLDVSLGRSSLSGFFNHTVYTVIKVGALCIYGAILIYLVLCGANSLPSIIHPGTAGNIFSAGVILPINLMVGFEVACTMYAFFTYFYRGELR